jgi:hypothetical protein
MNRERSMRGARYHEAGHAVAAYRHGYTITGVQATDEVWRTDYSRPPFGGYADAWREACITLAGQFADHVAAWGEMRPEPWVEFMEHAQNVREMVEDYGEEDARDDHLYILEYLEEMASYPSGGSLEACYRDVVEDTRQLLWDHWSEIEAVVCALEQTGTLDGAEVVQAIKTEAGE